MYIIQHISRTLSIVNSFWGGEDVPGGEDAPGGEGVPGVKCVSIIYYIDEEKKMDKLKFKRFQATFIH